MTRNLVPPTYKGWACNLQVSIIWFWFWLFLFFQALWILLLELDRKEGKGWRARPRKVLSVKDLTSPAAARASWPELWWVEAESCLPPKTRSAAVLWSAPHRPGPCWGRLLGPREAHSAMGPA